MRSDSPTTQTSGASNSQRALAASRDNVGVSGAFVCDGSQCDRNH